MKIISALRQLEEFGIVPLTGEADALSYRILCDLTKNGTRIVCEALGMDSRGLKDSWNSGTRSDPHIKSIMLASDAWTWLAPIALFTQDYCGRPQYHTVFTTIDDDDNLKAVVGLPDGEQLIREVWEEITKEDGTMDFHRTSPTKFKAEGEEQLWPTGCYGRIGRFYKWPSEQQTVGTRNVHAMSGRVT